MKSTKTVSCFVSTTGAPNGSERLLAERLRRILQRPSSPLLEIVEKQKVLDFLQDYYKKNGIAPMVRILSKNTGYKLKEVYELFPSGPGKGACKMAGLPKPTGCV